MMFLETADRVNSADSAHLLSFAIHEEVFRKAKVPSVMSEERNLCPVAQSAYVAYRSVKLFNDPNLEANTTLASSVLLAKVGVEDITNLSNKVTAAFSVNTPLTNNPVSS